MGFELGIWRGDCIDAASARRLHREVCTRVTVIEPDAAVDAFLAELAAQYPLLRVRPWRQGWIEFLDESIPVTPDLFGGYAILHVAWSSAALTGRAVLEAARTHGLNVYLPDGPSGIGPKLVCRADPTPSDSYWGRIAEWADELLAEIREWDGGPLPPIAPAGT